MHTTTASSSYVPDTIWHGGQGWVPEPIGHGWGPELFGQSSVPVPAGQGWAPELSGHGGGPNPTGQGRVPEPTWPEVLTSLSLQCRPLGCLLAVI